MIVKTFRSKTEAERWLDAMEERGCRPLDVTWDGHQWSAACYSGQ